METQRATDSSRLSPERIVLSVVLFAVGAAIFSFGNPLAVALPVAGTLSAGGLIWGIDRVQAGVTVCIPRTGRCWQTGPK